jgi:hypothetical protein
MATVIADVFGALQLPDTSGNVWAEPAALTQTNDRYPQLLWRYKDTGTKISVGFRFIVPNDYVGSPVFGLVWTSTATSGDVVWDLDYSCAARTASLDPSADEEALTVTSTAPGSSQTGVSPTVSATAANLSAGQVIQGSLSRDGASGSDTMAADAVLYGFYFQYANT